MPVRSTVPPALCLILLLISASPLRAQYKLPPFDVDKLAPWPCDIREEIQGLYSPTPLKRVRGVIHLFQIGRRGRSRVDISHGRNLLWYRDGASGRMFSLVRRFRGKKRRGEGSEDP